MADASVSAVFEPAFEHDGICIRVDVLERLSSGAWGLREVKSSSKLKSHYIDDIALQAYVLRGARGSYSYVRRLFNWAVENDLIESSPCEGLRNAVGKPPVIRDRILDDDELRAVWNAADGRLRQGTNHHSRQ
jgi:integrase